MSFRINSVWAFISQDDNGDEGIVASTLPGQYTMLPMIAADETRLTLLRPLAERAAKLTKKKIILIRLTQREDIEVIK